MTKRTCHSSVAICALLLIAATALAQGPPPGTPGQGPPQEVVERLLERGWKQVVPEVFQRPLENNSSYETLAFGADGLFWMLDVMETQLQLLESRRTDVYNPDLEAAIAGHIDLMDQTAVLMLEERKKGKGQNALLGAFDLDGLLSILGDAHAGKAAVACDTTLHRDASASTSPTGPQAAAHVAFNETCSAFFADPFCNAYAEGWFGTSFRYGGVIDDPPGSYGSASCSASMPIEATSNCFSYGEAQVSLQDEFYGLASHYILQSNYSCRPPIVTITGPSSVYVPAYACTTATWTSSVTGGSGTYVAYEWKYNGVVVGSGTSYSRTYCNNFPKSFDRIFSDTVALTVTDSNADAGTASKGVSVTYQGSDCTDPCYCPVLLNTEPTKAIKALPCPI